MSSPTKPEDKSPLSKWIFMGLAIPTFSMLLVYTYVAVLVFLQILTDSPDVFSKYFGCLRNIPESVIIYNVIVMWCVYIPWSVISKRLTWKEKVRWLFIIIFLNMVGMPMFYVFMLRRYMGIEGRTTPRDEAALDKLLIRCNVNREYLTPEQIDILKADCRNRRLAALWGLIIGVLLVALTIRMAFYFVPNHLLSTFATIIPTKVIIIDKTNGSKEEINPDAKTVEQEIKTIYCIGFGMGVMFFVSLMYFFIYIPINNYNRRMFIKFLKAGNCFSSNNKNAWVQAPTLH